jgi:hypothetical protein
MSMTLAFNAGAGFGQSTTSPEFLVEHGTTFLAGGPASVVLTLAASFLTKETGLVKRIPPHISSQSNNKKTYPRLMVMPTFGGVTVTNASALNEDILD